MDTDRVNKRPRPSDPVVHRRASVIDLTDDARDDEAHEDHVMTMMMLPGNMIQTVMTTKAQTAIIILVCLIVVCVSCIICVSCVMQIITSYNSKWHCHTHGKWHCHTHGKWHCHSRLTSRRLLIATAWGARRVPTMPRSPHIETGRS